MLVPLHYPAAAPNLLPVNLAAVDAAHLVRILAQSPTGPPPRLLVDCDALPYQRTLGICYLVSELLVLRQSGATVWLRNTSPVLRRCLKKMNISSLFIFAD